MDHNLCLKSLLTLLSKMELNIILLLSVHHYHPSSNGQVERFVCTFKQTIRAGEREGDPLDQRLENFLLMYRVTPHTTTGVPPMQVIHRS